MGPVTRRGTWQGLGRAGWLAVVAWTVAFAVVSIRVGLARPRSHSDYLTFANTARHWVAGLGLYKQIDETGFYDDFRYSPLVAVSLVPFTAFPDRIGSILWRWLNGIVFLGALGWWARKVAWPVPSSTQIAVFFLLVLPLAVGNVNNGQSNPLVLGLLLAGAAAVTEERWNFAAGLLALAILFKVYPIALALLLVSLYPRQLSGRLLLTLAAGLLLPLLLQKTAYVAEQYRVWFEYLVTEDRQQKPLCATYRDLRLLFRALAHPLSAQAYVLVQLATAAGAAGLCWLGRRHCWTQPRLLTFLTGLACVWMTVFGVATESCTYMMVAPTGAWALIQARLERRSLGVQLILFASFALFLLAQVANWFSNVGDFHAMGIQPFAGLLLLAGLVLGEFFGRPVADLDFTHPSACEPRAV